MTELIRLHNLFQLFKDICKRKMFCIKLTQYFETQVTVVKNLKICIF